MALQRGDLLSHLYQYCTILRALHGTALHSTDIWHDAKRICIERVGIMSLSKGGREPPLITPNSLREYLAPRVSRCSPAAAETKDCVASQGPAKTFKP